MLLTHRSRCLHLLLVLLLLMVTAAPVSAQTSEAAPPAPAPQAAFHLELPVATHIWGLAVQGWAPPGSVVTSPLVVTPIHVNETGFFMMRLQLKEGPNRVTASATLPDGKILEFAGDLLMDPAAPELSAEIPRGTNIPAIPVYGRTDPAATLTVNGEPVEVLSNGLYSFFTPHTGAVTLVVVEATDAEGRISQVRRQAVRFEHKAVDSDPVTQLSHGVPDGARVDIFHAENPAGRKKNLGRMQVPGGLLEGWTSLNLGRNFFHVSILPTGGSDLYHDLIYIVRPFELPLPATTNSPTLSMSGKAAAGWAFQVNGTPLTIAEDGSFALNLSLAEGKNEFRIRAEFGSGWYEKPFVVTRLKEERLLLAEPVLTVTHPAGSVVTYGGQRREVDKSGQLTLPLDLQPGENLVILEALEPGGTLRFDWLTVLYRPFTTIRLTVGKTAVDVDGAASEAPAAPVIVEGFTYVPFRFLGELIGAQVGWEPDTATATYQRNGRVMQVTIGAAEAVVDGKKVALPAPVRLIDGRTMVPLRFVTENLGAEVQWNGEIQEITLILPLK